MQNLHLSRCALPLPETLSPSVEGYGILVYDLAKKAGVPYRPNENTVAYFGMICY